MGYAERRERANGILEEAIRQWYGGPLSTEAAGWFQEDQAIATGFEATVRALCQQLLETGAMSQTSWAVLEATVDRQVQHLDRLPEIVADFEELLTTVRKTQQAFFHDIRRDIQLAKTLRARRDILGGLEVVVNTGRCLGRVGGYYHL